MNLQAEKLEAIQLLINTGNKKLIQDVRAFILSRTGDEKDWYNELSVENKTLVDEALDQPESAYKPHAEIIKKFAKWGLK